MAGTALAGLLLDEAVEVVELPAQGGRRQGADAALAGGHEAGEIDVAREGKGHRFVSSVRGPRRPRHGLGGQLGAGRPVEEGGVRFGAGPELEGGAALVHQHAQAAHGLEAAGLGLAQEPRLLGRVDDVVGHLPGAQDVRRQRAGFGIGMHADGRGVDDHVHLVHGRVEIREGDRFHGLARPAAQLGPDLGLQAPALLPVASRQDDAAGHALHGQGEEDGARRSAVADHGHRLAGEGMPGLAEAFQETMPVGGGAGEAPVVVDDGVDRAHQARGLAQGVQVRDDRLLMGQGHVRAPESQDAQGLHGGLQVGAPYPQRHVGEVEAQRREAGVVHGGGKRMGDGIPEDGDQSCCAADFDHGRIVQAAFRPGDPEE